MIVIYPHLQFTYFFSFDLCSLLCPLLSAISILHFLFFISGLKVMISQKTRPVFYLRLVEKILYPDHDKARFVRRISPCSKQGSNLGALEAVEGASFNDSTLGLATPLSLVEILRLFSHEPEISATFLYNSYFLAPVSNGTEVTPCGQKYVMYLGFFLKNCCHI